jgi:aldehyde dehydrogenase (NAD+)
MTIADPELTLIPKFSTLIGGDLRQTASGGAYDHVYAATGRPTVTRALSGAEDVDAAVAAARAAFPKWRAMPVNQRRNLLLAAAAIVEKHADELARLTVIENSNPILQVRHAPALVVEMLRYCAGWADKLNGELINTWHGPAHDYASYNPYGVVGAIVPWNGSLFASLMVMAPALAAGNCVVLKPSELAPFAPLRLAELFLEAGFPEGVVNVIPGGGEAGQALVSHPGVDKIQFVGSGPTARKILTAAAATLKPCGLELGGKSAVIVFDDADLKMSTQEALSGAIGANGQGCVNGTRILVQRGIYDAYLQQIAAVAGYIPVGNPYDEKTVLGPVISLAACNRILGEVHQSVAEGKSRIIGGGERLGGELADGFFLPITILADVDNKDRLAQHEVFGPVLTVTPFETEAEAVALANDTSYGLGGYIHTENLSRAHRVSAALDAGMIQVNGGGGMMASTPFGGYKQSGYGRLGGLAGIREFSQLKNVYINIKQ